MGMIQSLGPLEGIEQVFFDLGAGNWIPFISYPLHQIRLIPHDLSPSLQSKTLSSVGSITLNANSAPGTMKVDFDQGGERKGTRGDGGS